MHVTVEHHKQVILVLILALAGAIIGALIRTLVLHLPVRWI